MITFELPVYRYTVKFSFAEPAHLPPYKGSIIRGMFGMQLKKAVCVSPKQATCRSCIVGKGCAYRRILEPTMPRGLNVIDLPHPFVIEPPDDNITVYQPGDVLSFNLLLLGEAVEDFPYAFVALKGMEDTPIGIRDNRGLIKLSKITVTGKTVFNSAVDRLEEYRIPCVIAYEPQPSGTVTLKLVTPLRLKTDKQLLKRLPFEAFFKTLIRRISSLKYYYMGEQADQSEIRRLIELSGKIETAEDHTLWHDWKRYSSRQKEEMNLGGLVGTIAYSGEIKPFWPYIKLGELIHVGKNTSFGLGKYEIVK